MTEEIVLHPFVSVTVTVPVAVTKVFSVSVTLFPRLKVAFVTVGLLFPTVTDVLAVSARTSPAEMPTPATRMTSASAKGETEVA